MRGPLSRRDLLKGAVAGAATLTIGPTLWRQPWAIGAPPVAGIHLAYGADPQSQVTVSWSTAGSVPNARLEYGTGGVFGSTVAPETRALAQTPTLYHHAALEGLAPATTYDYRITHDGGDVQTGTFNTAPTGGSAAGFRMILLGDMGVTAGAAQHIARIAALTDPAPAFAFHVGDLCYAGRTGGLAPFPAPDQTVWDGWLAEVQPATRKFPWMTTVGNHEMEPGMGELGYDGYLARLSMPAADVANLPSNWVMRYGNVAIVALDGNDASFEIPQNLGYTQHDNGAYAQDLWLESTLASLRADPTVDFIIAGFHHCMYCTNLVHGSDGGVRQRWGRLFDTYQVDLAVNGHNHSYERTHPLNNGEIVDPAQGTVYLLAGGGGQAVYPTSLSPVSYVTDENGLRVPETAPWSAARYMDLSYVVADVSPGAMTLTTYGKDAAAGVVDQITLLRKPALALA